MFRRFGLMVLGLSFFVAPFTCAEDDPTAGLPEGVDPLPSDLGKKMRDLLKSAEKFRGLPCKHAVPSGSVGEAELKRKMLRAFEEELPENRMNPLETALKAFGFIPETMNLAKYYPELLTSQVGGFYDPKRKYLAIVQREGGLLGTDAKKMLGKGMAEKMEEVVLVHEFCHAIQDQNFDLVKYSIDDPLADAGLARTAVVEGDATLTMYSFFAGMNLENMPAIADSIKQMVKDPKTMMEMAPDMPGSKEMANAPSWFRDNLLFSYMQGFVFCIEVKKTGGQKLLDRAFTTDPPKSTEQIIHPEKWFGKRDDPVSIEWPDLSITLPGYRRASEGELGEQSIKVLLADKLTGEKDAGRAEAAAAGWGGDHYAVYVKAGARVLVWVTEWDTEKDAAEFASAIRSLGSDWVVEKSSPTRINIIRGKLGAEESVVVNSKLAEAKANRPANAPMEIAELKGDKAKTDKKNDKTVDDLANVLDNPELKGLLNTPGVKDILSGVLTTEQPAGALSTDGKSYVNEKLGFSIGLADSAKNWKLNPKPPVPMASVLISDPSQQAQVVVTMPPLPAFGMDIEAMVPMMEMGLSMTMKEYKKVSEAKLKSGSTKGVEIQFEAAQSGIKLKAIQRMYIINGKVVVLMAMAPAEAFETHAKALKETLDTFKFLAPRGEVIPDPKKE